MKPSGVSVKGVLCTGRTGPAAAPKCKHRQRGRRTSASRQSCGISAQDFLLGRSAGDEAGSCVPQTLPQAPVAAEADGGLFAKSTCVRAYARVSPLLPRLGAFGPSSTPSSLCLCSILFFRRHWSLLALQKVLVILTPTATRSELRRCTCRAVAHTSASCVPSLRRFTPGTRPGEENCCPLQDGGHGVGCSRCLSMLWWRWY